MSEVEKKIAEARKNLDALEAKLFQNAVKSDETPVFQFVFGTPGSGKTTRLIPKLYAELSQPFVLEIDQIKYLMPLTLPPATWKGLKEEYYFKFLNRAIDEKLSIITTYPYIVFTLPKLKELIEKARVNGYDISTAYLESSFVRAYEGSNKKQTDTNKLLDEQFRFKPDLFTMSAFHLRNKWALKKMQRNPNIFGKIKVFDKDLNER